MDAFAKIPTANNPADLTEAAAVVAPVTHLEDSWLNCLSPEVKRAADEALAGYRRTEELSRTTKPSNRCIGPAFPKIEEPEDDSTV